MQDQDLAVQLDIGGLLQQAPVTNFFTSTFVGPRTISSNTTETNTNKFSQTRITPGTIAIRYDGETFAQRKYVPTAEFVNGVLTLYLNTIEKG